MVFSSLHREPPRGAILFSENRYSYGRLFAHGVIFMQATLNIANIFFVAQWSSNLDGGGARGVVHQGQFSEGIARFEGAEGFVIVFPLDKDLFNQG